MLQEASLHQKLHPPQPLCVLHPESRGRPGERRHPLQQNLAVLQPVVSGEVITPPPPQRQHGATGSCQKGKDKNACHIRLLSCLNELTLS